MYFSRNRWCYLTFSREFYPDNLFYMLENDVVLAARYGCYGAPFGKNNNYFVDKVFFWCSIILFLSTGNTFLCYINFFLLTWNTFSCNINTFLSKPNYFLCNVKLFISTPNFCIRHRLECYAMGIYFYCYIATKI